MPQHDLEFHEYANLFPLIDDLGALVADIRRNGQRDPIILHEGRILDGRNRYRACQTIGIAPKVEPWDGIGDPLDFVVSRNLHRRHLSTSQRSQIAARIATLRRGQHTDRTHESSNPPKEGFAEEQAAKIMNVSLTSISRAKMVEREGTDDEKRAITNGDATVTAISDAIRARHSGGKPQSTKHAKRPKTWTSKSGRRMPEKPTAEVMRRTLDQLANTIEVLDEIVRKRPDMATQPDLDQWVRALEKSRLALSHAINHTRDLRGVRAS